MNPRPVKSSRIMTFATYAIPALVTVFASVILREANQVLLCAFALCLIVLAIHFGLSLTYHPRQRQFWLIQALAASALAAIVSVMMFHWPLRIAYAWSQPSLDRLALELRAGRQPSVPARAGVFSIQKAEIGRRGVVLLWTDLRPEGNMGFVQCQADRVPLNLWSMVRLDDAWQFVAED